MINMYEHSNNVRLGIDIGGSHIAGALWNESTGELLPDTFFKATVPAKADHYLPVLQAWFDLMDKIIDKAQPVNNRQISLSAIGIAMPGPFDYPAGISLIEGVDKYHALYGLNLKELIRAHTRKWQQNPNISVISHKLSIAFENDAACFAMGNSYNSDLRAYKKQVSITLGTGLGAAFTDTHQIITTGPDVPPGGYLYNTPLFDAAAEDFISSRWLIKAYHEAPTTQNPGHRDLLDAKSIAALALDEGNPLAITVFEKFGHNLGLCLAPRLLTFQADCLILGGGLTKASALFLPALKSCLAATDINIPVIINDNIETTAIKGAVRITEQEAVEIATEDKRQKVTDKNMNNMSNITFKDEPNELNHQVASADTENKTNASGQKNWRTSTQALLPTRKEDTLLPGNSAADLYNIYPFHALGSGKIHGGYKSLAAWMAERKIVAIDGYSGNDWAYIQGQLAEALAGLDREVIWCELSAFVKPAAEIDDLIRPYMGDRGAVWGTKAKCELADFYDMEKLRAVCTGENQHGDKLEKDPLFILFGIGAALYQPAKTQQIPIVYIDLPKNEIQYRLKAGSVLNLWASNPESPRTDYGTKYKRAFFIDWVVLDRHRQQIKNRIQVVADGQWRETIQWIESADLAIGFDKLATGPIRPRPWFAAGAWGGDWMLQHFPQLNKKEINYAWSFELIAPENGLVFESDGLLLEVAFDWLMEHDSEKILGADAARFGSFFPIRFDFLDTFHGGNLSIQCHPSLPYIHKHFGEQLTQDETYYIMDRENEAGVYLGFQEDIDPVRFKNALQQSFEKSQPIEIKQFVQFLPAEKHALYLIPNSTVHSAGAGNLVLEISATPYIFTFKMYDWLRPDLDGRPRPINIEHAFQNLDFDRKGEQVQKELISVPVVLEEDQDFKILHLPTHKAHFYDVHRIEFTKRVRLNTAGKCRIMMLVEGSALLVRLPDGSETRFHYGETFVLPAVVGAYELINAGTTTTEIKVIQAFVK